MTMASAEDHVLDAGNDVAELGMEDLRGRDQDRRADHRAPHGADAAEQGDGKRLRRYQHAEHRDGRDDQQHHGIEGADRAGDRSAQARWRTASTSAC